MAIRDINNDLYLDCHCHFVTVLLSSKLIIILIIRSRHSSWNSPSGLLVMGGLSSEKTTEKIEQNGTSTYSFQLQNDI